MRIVFLCSTPVQVQTFLPVSRKLSEMGLQDCIWLSLDPYYGWGASTELKKYGIKYISPSCSLRLAQQPIISIYRHLVTDLRKGVFTLLHELSPYCLVVGNDMGLIEKQYISISQSLNNRVILVQDGLLWKSEVYKFQLRDLLEPIGRIKLQKFILRRLLLAMGKFDLAFTYYGESNCDTIAVMGTASKEVLRCRGVSEQRLRVVGQPRFDQFLDIRRVNISRSKRKTISSIAIFPTRFSRIIHHDHNAQRRQSAIIQNLISYLSDRYHANILIKLSYLDSPDTYSFAKRYNNVKVVTNISSMQVIDSADVVITAPSTIISEAAILRTPFLVMRVGLRTKLSVTELLGVKNGHIAEITHDGDFESALEWVSGVDSRSLSAIASELVFTEEGTNASERLALEIISKMPRKN